MVNTDKRADLLEQLSALIEGRLSNDGFDDQLQRWQESDDAAVREIAEFGWTLYSSDTLAPYRLTGKRALRGEALAAANRCLRFLATEREYPWPDPTNGPPGEHGLYGCASFFGLGLGVLLGVASLPVLFAKGAARSPFPLFGIGIGLIGHWIWFSRRCDARHRAWLAENTPADFDLDAWPFARASDVGEA